MANSDTVGRSRANVIRAHRAAVHALVDCGQDFARADAPDWISHSRFRQLKRAGVVVATGTERYNGSDRKLWSVPDDLRAYIDQNIADPRTHTMCPSPDCPGSGFSTTADGYRCIECARPIRREHIERYYDGDHNE